MNARILMATLCGVLAACEPPPRQPARTSGAASGQTNTSQAPAVVAQTRFHVAQPLHQMKDSTQRVARLREQARGVVVPTYGQVTPQELNVINDTIREIQTLARVRFYPRPDGGWTDTTWTREPGLYTELIRASHEDYGLPVIELYGRWLRVYYGFAADGSPRAGWVHLVPGKSVYHDRDRQLFEYSTSLRDPANTAFFQAPDGQPVSVDLRPSYTLQVLRIDRDWIQVVLMRPDTSACTGNENFRVSKRDTVWVQRFNASGMRQLTSAVAGC
jgi:hypothetical protein